MKVVLVTMMLAICSPLFAQNIEGKLSAAINNLETDTQFKHAILSLYVVDSKTGKVVYDKNAQIGLAPASCQKVITSTSAFELLGKEYRYKTSFTIEIFDERGPQFIIHPSGDPTFGSWRFNSTKSTVIFDSLVDMLKWPFRGNSYVPRMSVYQIGDRKQIPSGWIFEDIANYYGAAAYDLNWEENQFDFDLIPGKKVGDACDIIRNLKDESVWRYVYQNECKTGPANSGDHAYIYFVPGEQAVIIKGTIPLGVKQFKISGADINPVKSFASSFGVYAASKGINISSLDAIQIPQENDFNLKSSRNYFYNYYSPPLDSINYWFLKKSINLYGEAFVKTIAYEKTKFGSTDTGVAIIKNFWKDKGIEPSAINIIDGSGLSPANRVTTNALVTVMQYAKKQNWFSSFYYDLPEINGIKMKDGYITGVRSYTGYIKSATGNEYTFSFIVNNFDGSPGTVREKMWKLLDILK